MLSRINWSGIFLCPYELNSTTMLSRINSVPFSFNPFHRPNTCLCVCARVVCQKYKEDCMNYLNDLHCSMWSVCNFSTRRKIGHRICIPLYDMFLISQPCTKQLHVIYTVKLSIWISGFSAS